MAVECTNCGEQLIGSVNCCWRCGHEFVSRPGPSELPPIRRLPVKGPLQEPLAAEVIVQDDGDEPHEATELEGRWPRRGSPFAAAGSPDASQAAQRDTAVDTRPRLPVYPRNAGSIGGTVVAIALGIISFCLAFFFPLGALIVAVLGLAMGIWGVYSRRRGAAILGLLICCVAFAIAGFNGAVDLYTYVHGISPFETIVPVTVEE